MWFNWLKIIRTKIGHELFCSLKRLKIMWLIRGTAVEFKWHALIFPLIFLMGVMCSKQTGGVILYKLYSVFILTYPLLYIKKGGIQSYEGNVFVAALINKYFIRLQGVIVVYSKRK